MTTAVLEQLVSEQICATLLALSDLQLDVALRIAIDITAYRQGVSPRDVIEGAFKSSWSDEHWAESIQPQLHRILGEPGGE